MENNFYVGVVFHDKSMLHEIEKEKVVLYTEDNEYYVDLLNDKIYSTDNSKKEYVMEETLVQTDINDFNVDYMYLLTKYKEYGREAKKRKFSFTKNTRKN